MHVGKVISDKYGHRSSTSANRNGRKATRYQGHQDRKCDNAKIPCHNDDIVAPS